MALSIFCPVKVFACLVRSDAINSIITSVGSVVAVSSLPGSAILFHLGHKDFVKPALILGLVGTATAILGLENASIRAEKTYAETLQKFKSNSRNDHDIIEAVKYLSSYYWMFWEEKIHNESEINKERLFRPNIPTEFAYAFGSALLKALEMKINGRYDKVCEREGNYHPQRWEIEFRRELSELDLEERNLWCDAKDIVKEFQKGSKAFNKQGEEKSKYRPLLYCTLVGLLQKYHEKYRKVLFQIRANKKAKISQQMAAPTFKLPIIPETFSESTTDGKSRTTKPMPTGFVKMAEIEDTTKMRELTAAECFTQTSTDPVRVSRFAHLSLSEEPTVDLKSRYFELSDSPPDSLADMEVKPDSADAKAENAPQ